MFILQKDYLQNLLTFLPFDLRVDKKRIYWILNKTDSFSERIWI